MTRRPAPSLKRIYAREAVRLVVAVLACGFCVLAMHVAAELFGGGW